MSINMEDLIYLLNKELSQLPPHEVLKYFISKHKNQIAFSTSLGAEDQVIIEMLASVDPEVFIFTLDTGRLFPETYELIERTNSRYKINIEVFFPHSQLVQNMVREKGVNLFYESIENRKLCCNIRKIEPLKRALAGKEFWITGLRRDQAVTRQKTELIEWDEANQIIKVNPIIDWSHQQVWDYIKLRNIPYNPLHDQGFLSIGCQPCTKAVKPGEDIRSGRWWWENPESKECGLHQK